MVLRNAEKGALCEVQRDGAKAQRERQKTKRSWAEMRLKGQEEEKMWNIRKCS